jgi:AraC-like DNA-binding protein/predicted transcriptional regulator YdeE
VNYLAQVQRGIDLIEARLGSAGDEADIELAAVARHAGISQWHFQKIFKALTGETLKSYIRARRFAAALAQLATADARIIDIALASGFETQESFTRAFRKAFGITPGAYRWLGSQHRFVRKVRIDAEYLRHINTNLSLQPELYEQPAMRLIGLRTRFHGPESEKNDMARKLPPLWAAFLERLHEVQGRLPDICFGVLRQAPERTDEVEYFAAAPVAVGVSPGELQPMPAVPHGMLVLDLPAARYARFTHRGHVANLDHTVNYIYASWLPSAGVRHTDGADLEFYGPAYLPDSDASVMHYAVPVADAFADLVSHRGPESTGQRTVP